jgi:predicted amidohydrolase YtcJ
MKKFLVLLMVVLCITSCEKPSVKDIAGIARVQIKEVKVLRTIVGGKTVFPR